MGMREHIYRLNVGHLVLGVQEGRSAGLGSRITADINQRVGLGIKNDLHHILMHAGARRVYYHHVGAAMMLDKFVSQDVLHIACVEKSVVQSVDRRVDFCIFDGFLDILDTDDLTGVAATKLAIVPVPV